ncbi:MAG TPA: peroxidase family protein [Cellulomonas sp.]
MSTTPARHRPSAVRGRVIEHVSHGAVLTHLAPASAFAYLLDGLVGVTTAHLPADDPAQVVALLRRLGGAMAEPVATPAPPSTIPAVYTYWGQFIDHDLTLEDSQNPRLQQPAVADPALAPVPPAVVTEDLGNARQPYLNLDSVYGDGPAGERSAAFYDGAFLKLGRLSTPFPGQPVPAAEDPDERDLPGRHREEDPSGRVQFPAAIGDSRNDENLVVSQLHVAYLRFHNAVAHALALQHTDEATDALLARAQRFVRHCHQWLIVQDYLRTVTVPGTVDWVLSTSPGLYGSRFGGDEQPSMPLEFSVAAFRFGHSQIRNAYDFNRNFGDPGFVAQRATLEQLFQFVGRGGFIGGATALPGNWAIEWDRFVRKADPDPRHFARGIDTQLADDL